jgi:urease accessory protein
MRRSSDTLAAGTWQGASTDVVVLDYDARHRRRTVLTCLSGHEVLLDLPVAVRLHDGDALRLDDGGYIEVRAAAEPLLELRTASAAELTRLAWHLGNRHVAAELGDGWLRIRPDHVLADLAVRLGATVEPLSAPFEPEAGAYAAHAHPPLRAP